MAGKLLSLEEAARHLGISVDEVNRLVDRKKLFPMRTGATVKFKLEDVDRAARDMGEDDSQPEDLSLDLDMSSPSLGGGPAASGIELGGDESESIFGADAADTGAADHTVLRSSPADSLASGAFDGDDLALDSFVNASSPSLSKPSAGGSGTIAFDLPEGGAAGDSLVFGSGVGVSAASDAGAALSGNLDDSGLSLEATDLQVSGIDLGETAGLGSGIDDVGGSLAAEAFELGSGNDDDESASVVIPTEDSSESSFFGTVTDDSASVEDSSASVMGLPGEAAFETVIGTQFNTWQILGLVCCTLLLLGGTFVMVDLVLTINNPGKSPIVLKQLVDMF
jgi:excisionase family DNA binding protein